MATTKATTLAHTLGGISSDISTAEINRLDGVTGDLQTQLDAKAPTASPTFTGTITAPNDSISGDVISGGTIGAGTFNGTIGSSATFPAGHIIQVKHFIFTGTQNTTTSFAPIQFDGTSSSTGYGCDITLSSASNKVLIFATISLGYQDGGYNTQATAEYSTNGGSSYSNLDVMHTDYWAFWEHAQGDLGQGYNLYTRSFSELKATGSTTNHFRMQIRKNTSNGNSTVNKAYLTNNYTDNTTIQLLEVVG